MKEQLYTIPVNDAFDKDTECPLCSMRETLEEEAIAYTLGPSYMEEDVRAVTDEKGFCPEHLKMLYNNQNRLGLALILNTHLNKINRDIEHLMKSQPKISSSSIFKKKAANNEIADYVDKLKTSCFICDKINDTFNHYIKTIYHLYKTDPNFSKKFRDTKGFCIDHYSLLYKNAPNYFHGKYLDDFIAELNSLYMNNMKRVNEDLEWFINKFDYRYGDEPWKEAKDAIPRTMLKTNSINL
ncbi:hypothetical protein EDD66_10826 [Mobilisporobacter senegalensis]|uniref:ABC transporter substrate-binding protein n=1 Tax=Mobilisporobacter senegalensis TaxID=1329262 RepID=A0A3N1XHZ2_9FIRM|nr:DUF6062 family protein [Mobilisporobacter senegalensis]ROR26304.1 hypothetical protein EDD66_10826 [Mobilisporobacter senegalensis]